MRRRCLERFRRRPVVRPRAAESEFGRLTVSADIRAASWVAVVDEPSGISVELPDPVAPAEHSWEQDDGSTWNERGYHHRSGPAFVVSNAIPADVDPLSVLEGHAQSIGGTIESSEATEVVGRAALDGVIRSGPWTYAYRIIPLDDWLLVLYVVGTADQLDESRSQVERMTASAVLP
jgi:hypothetical protein